MTHTTIRRRPSLATRLLAAPLGAALILAIASPSPGQTSDRTSPPAPAQTRDHESSPRFDLRFPGGTVAEYLEAIHAVSGRRNIVAMSGLDPAILPPIALDGVNTAIALHVIDRMEFQDNEQSVWAIMIGNAGPDVFTVRRLLLRSRATDSRGSGGAPHTTSVQGLLDLLNIGAYSSDEILSAIEVALEVSGSDSTRLRYHEETGTLFVVGTMADHGLIASLLETLESQAQEIAFLANELKDIQRTIRALTMEIGSLERHIAERRARHAELSAKASMTQFDLREIELIETFILNAMDELETARAMLRKAERDLMLQTAD